MVFKTLGPVNQDGLVLIKLLGHQLAHISGDNRERHFFSFSAYLWAFSASMQSFSVAQLPPANPPVKTSHSRTKPLNFYNPEGSYVRQAKNNNNSFRQLTIQT